MRLLLPSGQSASATGGTIDTGISSSAECWHCPHSVVCCPPYQLLPTKGLQHKFPTMLGMRLLPPPVALLSPVAGCACRLVNRHPGRLASGILSQSQSAREVDAGLLGPAEKQRTSRRPMLMIRCLPEGGLEIRCWFGSLGSLPIAA